MSLQVPLPTRRSTLFLAERLAEICAVGDLIVLSGSLGAGKTFLVRAMARKLALPRDERVTSPTFTLVQELPTVPPVVHSDLYRIAAPEEVNELGLLPARQEAVVIAEWGLPYIQELGGDALCLEIGLEPRVATVSASGPRSQQMLEALSSRLPLPLPARARGGPSS